MFLSDPDTYWHIATGQWMLSQHSVPRYDPFSFTVSGRPWVDGEWLSQLVLALVYQNGGWRALVLFTTIVVFLTFALLYRQLATILRENIALGVAAVLIVFAFFNFLARPHVLSFPIIVLWTAHLARASEQSRLPPLWLLPLMVLWANLHGGFTLGLLLTVAFGADAAIAAKAPERKRIVTFWIAFFVCALLASFVTPYGYKPIVETLRVFQLGETLNWIGEMRAVSFQSELFHGIILLILLGLALVFGARLRPGRVVLLLGLLLLAFMHVRGLALVALTAPFIVSYDLKKQFPSLGHSDDQIVIRFERFGRVVKSVSWAAFAASICAATVSYVLFKSNETPRAQITPAAAVDYAKAHLSGPVLNSYNFGGYLIFRGIKTFVDGRQLLFGRAFVTELVGATSVGGLNRLEMLADKYKICWTLFEANSIPAFYLDHSANWERMYADEIAVVHVRRRREPMREATEALASPPHAACDSSATMPAANPSFTVPPQ